MTGDLHCHTTFSDGSETPEGIVRCAERFGVGCAAITDHDVLGGAARAKAAAGTIKVISGVEISTYDYKNDKKVHLLCYEPKKEAELRRLIGETQQKRDRASLEILEKIRSLYPVDEEFVRGFTADSPVIFKHHIILALMHLGYACSVFGELYSSLFSRERGIARVEIAYPETREALRVALESGGVCVLAHPGVYHNFDIVGELAAQGLHGIEVWHPRQSEQDCRRADEAADGLHLLKTGGTDFHGCYAFRAFHFGTRTTPQENLEKMLELVA